MYSKGAAAQLKQEFWTAFGMYMSPILSADALKVNWINYKTGTKDLYFKMDALANEAFISIQLHQPDIALREAFFQQFEALKPIFEEELGEQWEWALHEPAEGGKVISKISKTIMPVSVFNREDWPKLISFFKPRIIALDRFWSSAQYSFQHLG